MNAISKLARGESRHDTDGCNCTDCRKDRVISAMRRLGMRLYTYDELVARGTLGWMVDTDEVDERGEALCGADVYRVPGGGWRQR